MVTDSATVTMEIAVLNGAIADPALPPNGGSIYAPRYANGQLRLRNG